MPRYGHTLTALTAACSALLCGGGRLLAADDEGPTRAAFLKEVLDAAPTPVTRQFNDYTKGSYHVEKADLLKGLVEEAAKQKKTLRAVVIVGPLRGDPLWTSTVHVFLQEGDKVRLNTLVMPHARITSKGTAVLTGDEYAKWLDGVLGTDLLQKQPPAADAPKGKDKDDPPAAAFAADILFVAWDAESKGRRVYAGGVGDEKKVNAFAAKYEEALKGVKETYPAK